jgi:phosphoribosylanthranilate isomerase
MSVRIKICGLRRPEEAAAVANAGAAYLGLVFFEKSPRNVSVATARALSLATPDGLAKVALVVNPSNEDLDHILDQVPIDIVQLHGAENPQRVAEIKSHYGLPVMKAVGIADETDLAAIDDYSDVADMLLVDAKPPRQATLPGGNGLSFDWRLIANRNWMVPWMLAGGLTPENVAEAVRLTGANQVDVSTGVEASPGIKDLQKIASFAQEALGAVNA